MPDNKSKQTPGSANKQPSGIVIRVPQIGSLFKFGGNKGNAPSSKSPPQQPAKSVVVQQPKSVIVQQPKPGPKQQTVTVQAAQSQQQNAARSLPKVQIAQSAPISIDKLEHVQTITRLFWLSALSCGIYAAYCYYLIWRTIRLEAEAQTGKKMSLGIMDIIDFVLVLKTFVDLRIYCVQKHAENDFSPAGTVFSALIGLYLFPNLQGFGIFWACAIYALIVWLTTAPIQRAINEVSGVTNDEILKRSMPRFEDLLWPILGGTVVTCVVTGFI